MPNHDDNIQPVKNLDLTNITSHNQTELSRRRQPDIQAKRVGSDLQRFMQRFRSTLLCKAKKAVSAYLCI